MTDKLAKYKKYANDVQSGKQVACKYVKQATKRYLTWFDRNDLEFKPKKVEAVVNFISHLKHFQGRHNGSPFELLPYQYWIICNIFGFYYKGTDKRVVRYVYIELARKNGKTALVAAILLYLLIADGENGSEVELVANSRPQAKICFDLASNFLQSIDRKGKYFKTFRDKIKFDKTKSFMQVLSADASGNDGYNSYAFCLDEAHEQKDSRLFDVMVSSQGMRENPLGIIITTAGFNKNGFCYKYRKTCLEILRGLKEDDTQFAAIYTLDSRDDWSDPKVWIKANPSLGVTVLSDYLHTQITKAKNNSSLEVGTRTKNLNQWVSSQDTWITDDTIMDSSQDLHLKDFPNTAVCNIGIDLASVSDLTAVSVMIYDDTKDKYYFKTHYYLPQSALENNSNAEYYKEWKRSGDLVITSGNVTDYDYVLRDIINIGKYININSIAYDEYNATQFAINATSEGLPLNPYSQSLANFNKPTKELERLIKSDKVVIDNNEITRWCFSNVALKSDHNENVKPIKSASQSKIDGVIAMIEALGAYLETPIYNNII